MYPQQFESPPGIVFDASRKRKRQESSRESNPLQEAQAKIELSLRTDTRPEPPQRSERCHQPQQIKIAQTCTRIGEVNQDPSCRLSTRRGIIARNSKNRGAPERTRLVDFERRQGNDNSPCNSEAFPFSAPNRGIPVDGFLRDEYSNLNAGLRLLRIMLSLSSSREWLLVSNQLSGVSSLLSCVLMREERKIASSCLGLLNAVLAGPIRSTVSFIEV